MSVDNDLSLKQKMLLNVSYNEPEVKKKIENAVGKPFSLKERWDRGGIGSSKLLITQASIDIHNLLILEIIKIPVILNYAQRASF